MGKARKKDLYVGVDVGGTKIQASVVEQSGNIIARERHPTPRKGKPKDSLAVIVAAIEAVLGNPDVERQRLAAIGLAVPGVVAPDEGLVVVTPNMDLTGLRIVPPLEERFAVPIALGNDVNMGILGEKWLGAARDADSAVGIFVGTGIGGGIIVGGRLVRGCREAAGEIGHMIMQADGPLCGCGSRGCLESLAGRSAIERDIRKEIAAGRKSVVAELLAGKKAVMRSNVLKRAIKAQDAVVIEVVQRAAEVLGRACLNVRHLLDPDVIVLGGGVIEACWKFVMPIVEGIVAADTLAGARPGCYVARSELGDDAVVLGAAAMAQEATGRDPLKDALNVVPDYPAIALTQAGEVMVGDEVFKTDIYIRGDGAAKRRGKKAAREAGGSTHKVGPADLEGVCHGRPRLLIVGTGQAGMVTLTREGEDFLRRRNIDVKLLQSADAVKAYNKAVGRKAILLHLSC